MKIKLASSTEDRLQETKYPVSFERRFAEFNRELVKSITEQYKNNTIKKLTKTDVAKFEDKKVGNYAAVFNRLSAAAKRKILKRFNHKRLDKFVRKFLSGVDKAGAKDLYGSIEKTMGIDRKQLMKAETLKPEFNALVAETLTWVEKLRDNTLEEISAVTLRNMALGKSLEEIMESFDSVVKKKDANANTMARTQIGTYNSLSTKLRAQSVGIEKAIWRTAQDERVRPAKGKKSITNHRDREGKEFELSKGCYSSIDKKWLLPGTDYNCRCTYIMVIPDEEIDDE